VGMGQAAGAANIQQGAAGAGGAAGARGAAGAKANIQQGGGIAAPLQGGVIQFGTHQFTRSPHGTNKPLSIPISGFSQGCYEE